MTPLYLGSLFERLDECLKYIVQFVGQYDVAMYVDASFQQPLIWERFGMLAPKLNEFEPVEMILSSRG